MFMGHEPGKVGRRGASGNAMRANGLRMFQIVNWRKIAIALTESEMTVLFPTRLLTRPRQPKEVQKFPTSMPSRRFCHAVSQNGNGSRFPPALALTFMHHSS
jgi:hypothetical protein